MSNIRVAWSRKSLLKPGQTTDKEGYSPMEFSFVDGGRVRVEAIRLDLGEASAWQKVLFASPVYLTRVEIWQVRDGGIYIYAWPDTEILKHLP